MQRLSLVDRQVIEYGLKMEWPLTRIAKQLARDHSVIVREVNRNTGEFLPYNASRAQYYTERRQSKKSKRKIEKNEELKQNIVNSLRALHSPEQIAGRLMYLNAKQTVCHETIYDYIYNGAGQYEGLYRCLRRGRPKRRKWQKRIKRTICIPERVSIDFRPETVTSGDWETDMMVFSKQQGGLGTMFKRKGLLCRISKLKNRTADVFEEKVQDALERLPEELRNSLTRDNGSENVKHTETRDMLGVLSFFCDRYCSWQKSGVENLNGLIRQYFQPRLFAKNSIYHKRMIKHQAYLLFQYA